LTLKSPQCAFRKPNENSVHGLRPKNGSESPQSLIQLNFRHMGLYAELQNPMLIRQTLNLTVGAFH
jgi:hypothetical protein